MNHKPDPSRVQVSRITHWIDGASAAPLSGKYLSNVSPMTGELSTEVASGVAADVDVAVTAAKKAADGWRRHNPAARGRLMLALAGKIRENRGRLVEMERADTGKPLANALAEVEGTALYSNTTAVLSICRRAMYSMWHPISTFTPSGNLLA